MRHINNLRHMGYRRGKTRSLVFQLCKSMGRPYTHSPIRGNTILYSHTILLYLHLGGSKIYQEKNKMSEYTLLAVISVILTIIINIKSNTKLLKQKLYYIFLLIIFGFKILVNGALTKNIVFYNPLHFSGLRIGTIPIEDFLFGFSMITCSILLWETYKNKK